MTTVQLNIRTPEGLIQDLDQMVGSGYFKNRTEAVNEAIRLLIRRYRILQVSKRIDEIGESNFGEGSLTEALKESRKEEDEL
jgi:Arc/MetJ-type ribon-helix-helix transcriptional regulator